MFGGSPFFQSFGEDPFFSAHRQHMQNMQSMFGGNAFFNNDPFAITNGRTMANGGVIGRPAQRTHHQLAPMDMFGSFGNVFNMNSMMGNMQRQFEQARTDPNSHCYTQSTVMSYSNTGNGQPKYYQATSSERRAPGGIKETKKSVRDSEAGIDKMAIGHHIYDKGHVVERSRNRRTGAQDESRDYINIDEGDLEDFTSEWKEKTSVSSQHRALQNDHDRQRREGHRRHRAERHAIKDRDRE